VIKTFFTLPSLEFVTASSTVSPDTPVGSILTEQLTEPAMWALDMAAAVSSDFLTLALVAPTVAGMILCILRAYAESELGVYPSARGISSYAAGGLGYFFAGTQNYRRAFALAGSAVFRIVLWLILVVLPIWAAAELDSGVLVPFAVYLPAGFPVLPFAIVLSALFLLLGLFIRVRRYLAAPIYIENPNLSIAESARCSVELMRGYRAAALSLELGFISWWLLGFFTLGIMLALFVIPYYLTCRVVFYRRVVELQKAKSEV